MRQVYAPGVWPDRNTVLIFHLPVGVYELWSVAVGARLILIGTSVRKTGKTGMTSETQSLLSDLGETLARASRPRRLQMLRQVVDLFFARASSYSEEQVAVFDAIIARLSQGAEPTALIELSSRLASIDGGPTDTIVRLSNDDDIAVSGPVLEKSNVLNDGELVGIAKTKGQGHLLAIAGRTQINDAVTDVLVDRGSAAVKRKVTANEGANFSENSFARLISDARTDKNLATLVAKREDIPAELQPFLEMTLT
jgi:uncharacterized protein (DUF2336 family)